MTTKEWARTGICKVCANEFQPMGHYDRERLLQVGICANCDTSLDLWRIRNESSVARIEGKHYIVGEATKYAAGFGGREFTIEYLDGRDAAIVTTKNLWHQGDVPAWLKDLLPNNAKFVNENAEA